MHTVHSKIIDHFQPAEFFHLENFFSTHLQVVVGTLPVIAGRLDPEHVPEVDADKVAVLCRDHSAKVGAHLKACFFK